MLTPGVIESQQAPDLLECELIFGVARFYKFYLAVRDVICLYDPETQTFRQDFSVVRYNVLYRAVDAFYRHINSQTEVPDDLGISNSQLSGYLNRWASQHGIPEEIVLELQQEITQMAEFSASLTYDSLTALSESAAFAGWLKTRLVNQAMVTFDQQKRVGLLTMDNLQQAVKRISSAALSTRSDLVINGASFVHGSRMVMPCAALNCFPLLTKALGGGFYWGEATMIAGVNASGKSILAMQMADDFATTGYRTVVFTTERRPDELFMRCVSNRLEINLKQLTDTTGDTNPVAATIQPLIPDWVWQNPVWAKELLKMDQIYRDNLLFIDWAQGQGEHVTGHFDTTMKRIGRSGWIPQIVIFDWIGGGLDAIQNFDRIRHCYQAAADHLINYAKRTGCIVIMCAQLDKAKVTGRTQYVDTGMLAESKGMTNGLANFIGITSMMEKGRPGEFCKSVVLKDQNLCLAKTMHERSGQIVRVRTTFEFQRFEEINGSRLACP